MAVKLSFVSVLGYLAARRGWRVPSTWAGLLLELGRWRSQILSAQLVQLPKGESVLLDGRPTRSELLTCRIPVDQDESQTSPAQQTIGSGAPRFLYPEPQPILRL